MEDRIQKLELRITELENKLKEAGASAGPPSIDPEDFKTYQKVSAQINPLSYSCSICIVTCRICTVCRVCNICINECSCGPCGGFLQGGGGGAGFGGFL
jgi:hypothetical protein